MNRRLWMMLGVLALSGCAGTSPSPSGSNGDVSAQQIYVSGQCGSLNRPEAVWIADPETWRRQSAQMMSLRMTPPSLPSVDFSREGVLLIAMGQQRSGGYGLSLAEPVAMVAADVLTVTVDWREPLPGRRVTQALTNPCLAVKLPDGAFSRLRVIDQEGRLRLEGRR